MKVRLTTFARNDNDLRHLISNRYCGGKDVWKNMKFVSDESYDRLVIFTFPYEKTSYEESKAITLMTEPAEAYQSRPHKTSRVEQMCLPLPFLPSVINGSCKYGGSGLKIKKNHLLSIVTSDLYLYSGHRARLEVVNYMDKVIESGLDIWGRSDSGLFFSAINNYKGPIYDKYNALWKYKYHFSCENSFQANYFTEKILDPILAECLCFYDGCTNITDFIDERAFIRVDVKDLNGTTENIIRGIEENEWRKRIKYIREQKRRLLNELHPLNIIWLAVNDRDVLKECKLK